MTDLMLLYATGTADDADRAAAERLLASGDPAAAAAFAEAEQLAAALAGTAGSVATTAADWEVLRSRLSPPPTAEHDQPGEWDRLIEPEPAAMKISASAWTTSLRDSPLLAAAVAALITLLVAYVVVRPRLEALALAESEVEHKVELLKDAVAARTSAETRAARVEMTLAAAETRLATAQSEADDATANLAEMRTELAVVRRRAESLTRDYAEAERIVNEAEAYAVATEARADNAEAALRLALDPASSLADLAQTGEQPGATGDAVLNRDQRVLRLAVAGLSPPADDRTYQAWALPVEGAPVSLGIFAVATDGTGTLSIDLPDLPDALSAVAVSLAPAGGEAAPTGPIVLVGELR